MINNQVKSQANNRAGDYIRNYENGFDGLRIYKKGDSIAQSAITIALGSPAELLITDSQGKNSEKTRMALNITKYQTLGILKTALILRLEKIRHLRKEIN